MDKQELILKWDSNHFRENALVIDEYLSVHHKQADYHFLFNLLDKLPENSGTKHLALLTSFTSQPLIVPLTVELAHRGIHAKIATGGFNLYKNEILNKNSFIYNHEFDYIIILSHIDSWIPQVSQYFFLSNYENSEAILQAVTEEIKSLLEALKKLNSRIIWANWFYPEVWVQPLHDSTQQNGLSNLIRRLNSRLVQILSGYTNVTLFDAEEVVAQFGTHGVYDFRMRALAGTLFSSKFLPFFAGHLSRLVRAIEFPPAKCLVCDLDNTLWGGIIGEDGLEGIQLGPQWPGNVYLEIQKYIKALSQTGILLALNSKNNEDDAREVFDKHPDCYLNWDDFVVHKVNWNNKVNNLNEIAAELNISTDSLVFVDDNPAELALVRQHLPEVRTIAFTNDVLYNFQQLSHCEFFDNLTITKEDFLKSQMIKANLKREKLKKNIASLEEYYFSLEMKAQIKPADSVSLERISQLTQKTNQFNLTTRRYSVEDVRKMTEDPDWRIWTMRLVDRFGDNGITAVAIIHQKESTWEIDSFLMSCRIIGRTAEQALLAHVLQQAGRENIESVFGLYIPTPKNSQVKDFYQQMGFKPFQGKWKCDIPAALTWPDWIKEIDGKSE